MKEGIQDKLIAILAQGITKEAELIYVFVEIRKLLDYLENSTSDKYQTLYFYCNWMLHIKMDRSPAVKVLEKFDNAIDEGNHFAAAPIEFVFKDFFIELSAFLIEQNLPADWIAGENNRLTICDLLISILEDIPLENSKGRIIKFAIKRFISPQKGFHLIFTLSNGAKPGFTAIL